jgi:hypothetical protein
MSVSIPNCVAVYGALRSGTTLLRLMLDQNSHLSCPTETDFLFDYGNLNVNAMPIQDAEALSRDRIYRYYCDSVGIDPAQPRSTAELVRTMVRPQDDASQIVVLKLHRNLARMRAQMPNLKILHLIRDPRDVARSSIGMGWAGSTYYGVRHWINTEQEWAAMVPYMAPEQVLEVKYETLIEEPEETLTKICLFFGVQFQPSMLEYDQNSTYSKPDAAMTYQWRRKQTLREVGLVEAQAEPLMHALGYKLSGHSLVHPNVLERATLAVGHRRATWSTRIERFGLKDSILVMLSRRLMLPALGQAAQRRIDEKTIKYLK